MNPYTGPGLSCNWTGRHVTDVMQCGDTVMKRASLISHVQPEVCSTPVCPCGLQGRECWQEPQQRLSRTGAPLQGLQTEQKFCFSACGPKFTLCFGAEIARGTPWSRARLEKPCECVWTHPPHPQPEPSLFSSHNQVSPIRRHPAKNSLPLPSTPQVSLENFPFPQKGQWSSISKFMYNLWRFRLTDLVWRSIPWWVY